MTAFLRDMLHDPYASTALYQNQMLSERPQVVDFLLRVP